jgi:hypothetical protein
LSHEGLFWSEDREKSVRGFPLFRWEQPLIDASLPKVTSSYRISDFAEINWIFRDGFTIITETSESFTH